MQTSPVESGRLSSKVCEREQPSFDLGQHTRSQDFTAHLHAGIEPAKNNLPTDQCGPRRRRFQSLERVCRSTPSRRRHRSGSPRRHKSSDEMLALSLQKELIKELTSLQKTIGDPMARSTPQKQWKVTSAETETSMKKASRPWDSEVSQDSGLCTSLQDASKPSESAREEIKKRTKYPSHQLEISSVSVIPATVADNSTYAEKHTRPRDYLNNWNFSRSRRIRKTNGATDLSNPAVLDEVTHSVRLKRSGAMRRYKAPGSGFGSGDGDVGKVPEDGLARLFWFDVDRRGAEECLARNHHPEGAFLLRPSSEPNVIALSLKTAKQGRRNSIVKHFRIKFDPQRQHYFLSKTSVYSSLDDFIRCHEVSAGGLPCRLVPSSADGITVNSPSQSTTQRQWNPISNFHINRNSLVLNRRIGCGSFGEVWLAYWPSHGYVAAKRMLGNEQISRERFLREAEIMCRLQHPHIVRLLGVCSSETTATSNPTVCTPAYIITELMAYGSLKTFVQNPRVPPLGYEQLIDFMVQISDGMSYLERQNYLHRDLRASNVLVGENLTLKVADFGLAHMLGDDTEYLGNVGNYEFYFDFTSRKSYKLELTMGKRLNVTRLCIALSDNVHI
ncbi:hypothetical protein SprV_0301179000 [Sparganum proliferum]